MEEVLKSTQYVVQQSLFVHINTQATEDFVSHILKGDYPVPSWDYHHHFCGDEETTAAYLLVLDTLNFCFWTLPGEPRWEIPWQSEKISGYVGLAAALKQALSSRIPITDPAYLSDMTLTRLKGILGGKKDLPLMEKRVENLRELGHVLSSRFDGKTTHLIESCHGSAVELARLLARDLPSFCDTALYKKKKIYFYKRAQIFASDLYGAFNGGSWGAFHDMDQLTAFADYKVPQVLRHLGILRYEKELSYRVDSCELIEEGSPEEVEIRANTIWAVEGIRHGLKEKGKDLQASHIDGVLWNLGQEDRYRTKPYHRTKTIYY